MGKKSRGLALLALSLTAFVHGAALRKHSEPGAEKAGGRSMKSLSLREKVAQLIVIPFNGLAPNSRSREYRKFVHLIRDVRVGGLILVNVSQGHIVQRAQPYALAAFVNRMQRIARTPLLVSGDFERGASMRVEGTTVFPHAMAFAAAGGLSDTFFEGEVTARESRAMGVHWVFYPDADVNNNPDNPIINIRSFGENPQVVSAHVQAFIEGTRSSRNDRVLTTVKHFPGHGDTATDTHLGLATITAGRERLDQVELPPFRAAIAKGVDAVMTAHIAVPALDAPDIPATLSPAILTRVLREEMGFRGLVVTDALDMGSIVKGFGAGEASVRAIEAGADVLLIPPDPEAAVNAIVTAIRQGRLTQKRIEQSVARVMAAKERVGLNRHRLVDLEAIADIVNSPEANERAQQIADRAVTLVKNANEFVPLRASGKTCFVILTESRYSLEGQAFSQEVRRRAPNAPSMSLDPGMADASLDEVVARAGSCESVVIAAFASVAAYRGNVALGGGFPKLVDTLAASGKPVALIALGNPYLLRSFPNVSAYLATYSTVAPSEIAAAKALFGEIPIRGRLPITIPDLAKYGEGIQLPAKTGVP